jgi:hypothetical protein
MLVCVACTGRVCQTAIVCLLDGGAGGVVVGGVM